MGNLEKLAKAGLSPMQKQCLIGVYHQGFLQSELADLRGISRQAVSAHLKQAVAKLKKVGIPAPRHPNSGRIRPRTNWSLQTDTLAK